MAANKRYKVDTGDAADLSDQAVGKLEFVQQGTAGPPSKRKVVLIWDIDETLIIFNSLMTGSWAASHGLNFRNIFQPLGERWEAAILNISDHHFFYTQIEEYDQTCMADVAPFDDGTCLVDYDFYRDGFPPAPPAQQAQRAGPVPPSAAQQAQHAASARPLPQAQQAELALAAAADVAGLPAGQQAQQEEEGMGQVLGSAAPPQPVQQPNPLSALQPLPLKPAAGSAASPPQPAPAQAPGGRPGQALSRDDLRKLAYRYRYVSALYRFGLQSLWTAGLKQEWQAVFEETDSITGHWLTHAADLLAACSQQLPSVLLQLQQGQGQQQQSHPGSTAGEGDFCDNHAASEPAATADAAAGDAKRELSPPEQQQQAQQQQGEQEHQGGLKPGPPSSSQQPLPASPEARGGGEVHLPLPTVTATAGAAAGGTAGTAGTAPDAAGQEPNGPALWEPAGDTPLPLQPTQEVEVVHVAVTSGQLIPSLAKLLLFRLSVHFAPDRVYSSRRYGKGYCFDRVRERWGDDETALFVVIGDGSEEDEAASERGWPYLRVLLTDVMAYPAAHVLRLRRDALGSYGLTLPGLQVQHIARAALSIAAARDVAAAPNRAAATVAGEVALE